MMTVLTREKRVVTELEEAIASRLRGYSLRTPLVFEQNDCVVVEIPAPATPCEELELSLDGDILLTICDPQANSETHVVLPAPVSLIDSVIFCVGGVLSMTFVKADAVDRLEDELESEPLLAEAG